LKFTELLFNNVGNNGMLCNKKGYIDKHNTTKFIAQDSLHGNENNPPAN
jgi:hypothetical protein